MPTWLCAPPSKHLEAGVDMSLDSAAAMLQGDVEVDEGSNQVWAEVLLQAWLLHSHPLEAEAKEQPDASEEVLPRDSLQGRALPVQLDWGGCPSLELCQLLLDHHSLGKIRLEQRQGVPQPWGWPSDWGWRKAAGQGLRNQQARGIHTGSAVKAEYVLWGLQDAVLAWPLEALKAGNSIRVHPKLCAGLDSNCQADDIDLAAMPAGGPILEGPVAIWAFHAHDG